MLILFDFMLLVLLAYFLIQALNIISSLYEKLALAGVLALGLKSVFLFSLIVVGVRPEADIQLTGSLLLFLVVLFLFRWKASCAEEISSPPVKTSASPQRVAALAILGGLFVLSVSNAWFFPLTETDALWYEIRGMRMFHEARFNLEIFNQEYPPLVPFLFTYQISFQLEKLKIIFPLFYLCLLVIFYRRVLVNGENETLAATLTLILGTTPFLWWHSVLPFMNLVAGLYFSLGSIYWFFLLKETLIETSEQSSARLIPLALLSGSMIGLACWTRLEFVLYGAIPILMLSFYLQRNEDIEKSLKNHVHFCFSCSILTLPTIWIVSLYFFQIPAGTKIQGTGIICLLLWVLVMGFPYWSPRIVFKPKHLLSVPVVLVAIFFVVLAVSGPDSVSFGMAILLGLYRTVVYNIYFSVTVVLVMFLFLEPWKNQSAPVKLLGGFLLAYLFVHFAIYTFMPPKWDNLKAYIDATFIHPGNAVNSSGVRGMIAFYPIFVFFISCLKTVRKGFES
ncbi:MAG: hypothetical protein VX667_02725 [Nitrospinota bacterium]|nr:hypothetical protein [Nitrospinota bacterium]